MSIKIKCPLLLLLLVIIVFNMVFLPGCALRYLFIGAEDALDDREDFEADMQEEYPDLKESLDKAITDAEKEIKAEKEKESRGEAETLKKAEQKIKLPDDPVTYTGYIDKLYLTLTVDFTTGEVSGSFSYEDDYSYDEAEIAGDIDIESLEITASYSGVTGSKEWKETMPLNGTIDGIISKDFNNIDGTLWDDDGLSVDLFLYR